MTREDARRSVCREMRCAPVPTCLVYIHTPCLPMIPCRPRAILGRLALLVISKVRPSCLSNPSLTRTCQGTCVACGVVFCMFTLAVSSNLQSSTRIMRVCCVGVSLSHKQLSCFFASAYSWWWAFTGKPAISSAYHTPRSSSRGLNYDLPRCRQARGGGVITRREG